ncbi:50S ribosomal protein L15 [candidate division WWE3 bacterium CG_4_9_14_3_um_filter_41_6]|uniref:Large ribosomal subunit protein uL15 n=1 Tax=candidate division WWE3 bacterium CG_4_10_14_0_2_um_filter_41_14 TaxID=1975072 RepID=A0A2M7TF47_UNCKA|nr:MAG: 50S ribosomal protein L15 [candidate division WWE3 bacterium CG_4_10_14_0_2_um_filter_41_14]PJA38803.1 MAG: 50S ribosomal protein L15 [candidate division WWE3 bacterium CG_4_9_14_3_um_filter_41_6]
MAFIHQLIKINDKAAKRVGRGKGSGKGKGTGRGEAGQKKRTTVRAGFEGGQARLVKRLPFLRGKSFRGTSKVSQIVSIAQIEKAYVAGEVVSLASLKKKGLIDSVKVPVKLLSGGNLTKNITIHSTVGFSAKTREKVEAVGGIVND